jgi:HAE1 family hydrophobic/amphiphilic exporter-1
MQWLSEISVRRPVLASVIVLVFVVVGIFGYTQLQVDRFPKIDFPTVAITTSLIGATPNEIETEVTDRIEEAINTISGIDEIRSTSSESISLVLVTFLLEKDIDVAAQEVREKITRIIPDLPEDVDAPIVEKLDPDAAPIINISISADASVTEITEFADKTLRRQLENVTGVGQVRIVGGRKRQINVQLDPMRLQSFGLTAIDAMRAIKAQNIQIPAGNVKDQAMEAGLRVVGKVESIEALRQLVIRPQAGRLIRLEDVAEVVDGEEEPRTAASQNGIPSVILSIRKQSGANTIAVVDAVVQRLEEIKDLLPDGYETTVVRDYSRVIRTSVHAVKEHLILGAIFASLVVLLFLGNSRATIISSLSIPTSIIAAFGMMWVQNMTINQISLIALALAVGIVIDDAIIVVENIFRRMEEKGESAFQAAIEGTREIGMAVVGTTLSLLAVFVPIAFLGGIVGMFIRSFGMTMAFAIGVSMLVSFTMAPALAAKLFHRHEKPGPWDRALEHGVNLVYRPIEQVYMKLLGFSLNHRWVVVAVCLTLLGSLPFLMQRVKKDFLPPVEEAEFVVNLRAPEGSTLEATDLLAERVARDIRKLPGVLSTLTTIGDNLQQTVNAAGIFVRLTPPDERDASQQILMDRVRQQIVPKYPEEWRITVFSVPPFNSGMSEANVQYYIAGPDLDQLTRTTEAVMEEAKQIPGVRDLDSTLISGKPEILARIDRSRAGLLGVNIADLSTTLRLLVGGVTASSFSEGGEQYDIHVRALKADRSNQEVLSKLSVPSMAGPPVALPNIVQLEEAEGPSQINRLNRRRQVTITANNAPGYGETQILEGIEQAVETAGLPKGFTTGITGRTKEMKKAGKAFMTAFVLALVFMYLILAAVFESWLHPFTILLSLPLTLPFAILSLIVFGQSINIFSMLGILVLFGMVKKNGVLQISHTNQLRQEGLPRHDAVMRANRERLRPILMTTLAFVAGMIPMMLAKGVGAAFNNATAGVIVGGQMLSLLLTLLAIPVFYTLFDDMIQWRRKETGSKIQQR